MTVKAVPAGYHTITPYLVVQEATQLIDFVKQAFAATKTFRSTGFAGGIHAEVRIGDSMVMIGGSVWKNTSVLDLESVVDDSMVMIGGSVWKAIEHWLTFGIEHGLNGDDRRQCPEG